MDKYLEDYEFLYDLSFVDSNIEICFIERPFLLGLYISSHNCSGKYGIYPTQNRFAFEVKYNGDVLDEKKELGMCKRVIYYINSKYDIKLALKDLKEEV